MNTKKLFIASTMVAVAAAAQAQITLTAAGTFLPGGVFTGNPAPTYSGTTTSVTVVPTGVGTGTLDGWYFNAQASSGTIGDVTYQITLSGITPTTIVGGAIEVQSYDAATGVVGSAVYTQDVIVPFNVELTTLSTAYTQTFDITTNITAAATTTAFYEGNITIANVVPEPSGFAAVGFGALGLLIRRRRSSK